MRNIKKLIVFVIIISVAVIGYNANKNKDKDVKVVTVLKIEDLEYAKIGVLIGSTHDIFVTENYPKAHIYRFDKMSNIKKALLNNEINVGILDMPIANIMIRDTSEIQILPKKVFKENFGVGFPKESVELCSVFNEFLLQLKEGELYEQMYKKWHETTDTTMPELNHSKKNGKIKVGISTDIGLPFVKKVEDDYIGFDIELIQRFAAHLGKEIIFVNYDFPNMLESGAKGDVDLFISSTTITRKRSEKILFSDIYYESGAVMITLK